MKLTPEASMRMRASPGPGVGVGRSRRVRTSAEPVVRIWMACMAGCQSTTPGRWVWREGHGRLHSELSKFRRLAVVKLADCFVHLKLRYQIRRLLACMKRIGRPTMPNHHQTLPIAIYYEQPNWFKPLFAELDRRGTNYVKLDAVEHSYGPGDKPDEKYALVLNKMSPSAWNRGHGDQIFYTLGFLEHLESRGVRVVNGVKAFRSELSKATQLAMLERLGLGYPKARVIHRSSQASAAAEGLRFPVVVKPNIGGSGSGVVKFNT